MTTKADIQHTSEPRKNGFSTFPTQSSLRTLLRCGCLKSPVTAEALIDSRRLCGGLTCYSPLVRNGAGPGKNVGVVGLGGL